MEYNERLGKLNLTSLETRRLRGDMMEVFRIMKSYEEVMMRDFIIHE